MKHTPGPWKLDKSYSWRIVNDADVCVASPHGPQGEWEKVREEHTANAALIVAAPEMYKLLKDLQAWFEGESFEYSKEIENVIAKAESL